MARSAPLIFLDTETTGLHKARRPWEIALIKRADTGQTRLLLCVDVRDLDLEDADPVGLRISGFHRRHPQARHRPLLIPRVYRAGDAAGLVHQWTAGATIVGVVPRFDAECIADMFDRHGMRPAWNDDLVDVVPLATAAMRAARREPASDVASLSRQCGVKPPAAAQRHTALGDARWAMRWYDKLLHCDGGAQSRE